MLAVPALFIATAAPDRRWRPGSRQGGLSNASRRDRRSAAACGLGRRDLARNRGLTGRCSRACGPSPPDRVQAAVDEPPAAGVRRHGCTARRRARDRVLSVRFLALKLDPLAAPWTANAVAPADHPHDGGRDRARRRLCDLAVARQPAARPDRYQLVARAGGRPRRGGRDARGVAAPAAGAHGARARDRDRDVRGTRGRRDRAGHTTIADDRDLGRATAGGPRDRSAIRSRCDPRERLARPVSPCRSRRRRAPTSSDHDRHRAPITRRRTAARPDAGPARSGNAARCSTGRSRRATSRGGRSRRW